MQFIPHYMQVLSGQTEGRTALTQIARSLPVKAVVLAENGPFDSFRRYQHRFPWMVLGHMAKALCASSGAPAFQRARVDLGSLLRTNIEFEVALRALANDRRLQILEWLKKPVQEFPAQVDGDLIKDGVCGLSISKKLGISQPTTSEHLSIMSRAGLIQSTKIKQWTFYKRDEKRIKELKRLLASKL